jgi:hypothetical protein
MALTKKAIAKKTKKAITKKARRTTRKRNSGDSFATITNRKLSATSSVFVTISERIAEFMTSISEHAIDLAIKKCSKKLKKKKYKSFKELPITRAVDVLITDIIIETTVQRDIDWLWLTKILSNFSTFKIRPISVYENPDRPGEYVCWDGQHTLLALYLIITKVFGENPKTVTIPVNISPATKSEIRELFVGFNNGDDSKKLSDQDIHKQQVLGVRVDKSTNPVWKEVEKKQTTLEDYDHVITAGTDITQINVISRYTEIKEYSNEVLECVYKFRTLISKDRAVEPKEIFLLCWYFNECIEQNIKITKVYMKELVSILDELFDGDFSPSGPFWNKVEHSYFTWYDKFYAKHPDKKKVEDEKKNTKQIREGGPFLLAQLSKSFSRRVPAFIGDSAYTPSNKELW